MDAQTKSELLAAVNLLIQSPNAHALYQKMLDVAPLLARHKDLRLIGEADDLNTLARIKVSHPDTYEGIIQLVEQKRAEAGFEPLATQQEAGFDKVAYMQQFMEQKRVRQRRAADIENLQRPERDRLIGKSRLEFMDRKSAQWKAERDEMIDKAKKAAAPRVLKKDDIQTIVTSFWAKVDAKLDALEAAARSGKYHNSGTSLADLEAALRHDPYK